MIKVTRGNTRAVRAVSARPKFAAKKCRICGNTFVAQDKAAKTCKFCNAPFHNIAAGIQECTFPLTA